MNALDLVNPLQGTANSPRFSRGNVLPICGLPHGNAGFTFQTNGANAPWFFHPDDACLEGIRLTHQPSPWVGDYGQLVLMPNRGKLRIGANERCAPMDRTKTKIFPHAIRGYLYGEEIEFSLAPAENGARLRFRFFADGERRLTLHTSGRSLLRFERDGRRIIGWTSAAAHTNGFPLREYFVLAFDVPADEVLWFGEDGRLSGNGSECEGAGITLTFSADEVDCRWATSFLSQEQAEWNLQSQLSFSQKELERCAREQWERTLGRLRAEDADERTLETFYSCLYRTALFPRRFHERDASGRILHPSMRDGSIQEGVLYVDTGFWDTYRTLFPLYSLIEPEQYAEMLEGFLNFAKDTGYLPKWPSPVEVGIMPGALIEAVVADAVCKGIAAPDFAGRVLPYLYRQAERDAPDPRQGRKGSAWYARHGYLACDLFRESVNHTLDSAYGDFCISVVAQAAGQSAAAARYRSRSENYRKLFDPVSGFLRGRDSEGRFRSGFDPLEWGGDYCEGGAWQNGFSVCHDLEGLAALYGGPQSFLRKIDELLAMPPRFRPGGYGQVIHEMSEMAALGMGQCAISNEPSFHIPWLYSYFGQPERSARLLEKLVTFFTPNAYPGDEDNGAMAAWYLFAMLGIYPICPGKPEFAVSAPLIDARIRTGEEEFRFVKARGETTMRNIVSFSEICRGGRSDEVFKK